MICCYRSIARRKKRKTKKVARKKEEEKKVIWFVSNTLMLPNWVEIEMEKTLKTIKFYHNNF